MNFNNFNIHNLIKYLIMFIVTTISTFLIPTCGVLKNHAIYVGLISASTFALIDICSPHIVLNQNNNINSNILNENNYQKI